MRVAVAGGTGVVGTLVVGQLRAAGHEPVVLARSRGVDVIGGRGVRPALEGCGVVVDVTSVATTRASTAVAFFETAARTLGAAARDAGVAHLVVLSIVGIDRVAGFGYYTGKLAQERAVLAGEVPATVLRATQFHEFAGQLLARTARGGVAVVPRMLVQPVAASCVAEALVRVVDGPAVGRARDLAGPRQEQIGAMARAIAHRDGRVRRVVVLRLPGATGRALAGGALLPGPDATLAGPTYDAWLNSR